MRTRLIVAGTMLIALGAIVACMAFYEWPPDKVMIANDGTIHPDPYESHAWYHRVGVGNFLPIAGCVATAGAVVLALAFVTAKPSQK